MKLSWATVPTKSTPISVQERAPRLTGQKKSMLTKTLFICLSFQAAIIRLVGCRLTLDEEQQKNKLPAINNKPFTGVKANVDFLSKNKEAAKLLTRSQSQAREILVRKSQAEKRARGEDGSLKMGQIPDYILWMKRNKQTNETVDKRQAEEQEKRNRSLETTNQD